MAAQLRRPFSANAARLAGAPEAAKRPSYFDRLAAQRAEDEGVASTLAPMERLPVIGGERAAAKPRPLVRPASARPRPPSARGRPGSAPANANAERCNRRLVRGAAAAGKSRGARVEGGGGGDAAAMGRSRPASALGAPAADAGVAAAAARRPAAEGDATALRFLFTEREVGAARRLVRWGDKGLSLSQRAAPDVSEPSPELRHLDVFAEPAPGDADGRRRWDAAVQALLQGEGEWPRGLIPPLEAIAKEAGATSRVAYIPIAESAEGGGAFQRSGGANWRRYASQPIESPVDVEVMAAWASEVRLSAGSTAGAEEVRALLRLNQSLLADLLARRTELFAAEAEHWERRANQLEAVMRSRGIAVPAATPMPPKVAAEVKRRRARPPPAPRPRPTTAKPAAVVQATTVKVPPHVVGDAPARLAEATRPPRSGTQPAKQPQNINYIIEEESEDEPDEVVYAGSEDDIDVDDSMLPDEQQAGDADLGGIEAVSGGGAAGCAAPSVRVVCLVGGTLADEVSDSLGLPVLHAQALVEEEIEEETALGKECLALLSAGKLVPTSLLLNVLATRIGWLASVLAPRLGDGATQAAVVLEGFPQSAAEAAAFDAQVAPLAGVVYVGDEAAVDHELREAYEAEGLFETADRGDGEAVLRAVSSLLLSLDDESVDNESDAVDEVVSEMLDLTVDEEEEEDDDDEAGVPQGRAFPSLRVVCVAQGDSAGDERHLNALCDSGSLEAPVLSVSALLEEEIENETVLGQECLALLEAGKLVPSSKVITIIATALGWVSVALAGAPGAVVVLDGFPRTAEDASALDAQVAPLAGIVAVGEPEGLSEDADALAVYQSDGRLISIAGGNDGERIGSALLEAIGRLNSEQ